ncbi:MAG: hypothetical protein K6E76_07405 [Patescibacteria group bacterium]|nr:hypothetical protein [Patescibacteria group bacterium]
MILISDGEENAHVTFLAEKQDNEKINVQVIDSQRELLENGTVFEFTQQNP